MSFLSDARVSLKALLEGGGYRAYDYRPDRLSPPAAVIEYGDPYLVPGQTFREWSVSLQLVAIVAPATNQKSTELLDEAIADLVELLRGEWTVQSVRPVFTDVGDKAYLAAEIQIQNQLTKEST